MLHIDLIDDAGGRPSNHIFFVNHRATVFNWASGNVIRIWLVVLDSSPAGYPANCRKQPLVPVPALAVANHGFGHDRNDRIPDVRFSNCPTRIYRRHPVWCDNIWSAYHCCFCPSKLHVGWTPGGMTFSPSERSPGRNWLHLGLPSSTSGDRLAPGDIK